MADLVFDISGTTKWSQQQSTASPSCIQELFNVWKGRNSRWTCEERLAVPHKRRLHWTWYEISSWPAQLFQGLWSSFLRGLRWSWWSKGLHSHIVIWYISCWFCYLMLCILTLVSRRVCVRTSTASETCYLKGYTHSFFRFSLNPNGFEFDINSMELSDHINFAGW